MKKNKITNFDDLLDSKYGKRGTAIRETWEHEFEAYKLGVLIEDTRKIINISKEELAVNCK